MARWIARVVLVLVGAAGCAAAGASLWSPAGAAPPPDLTYNAVPPCVVFDSRPGQGATGGFVGPINGNQAVTYDLTGTFPAAQGGNAPGATCGIPEGAAAVEINVVAVNALNEGNLRVTDGSPGSTGGVVNYTKFSNAADKLNTSNAVIVPLDATGHVVVTPNCGVGCTADTVDVRGIVLGYFTNGLAQRLAALETKLSSMSATTVAGVPTVRFTGVNLQVLNGLGTTESANSAGNLILGYNTNDVGAARTGSHNLVIGDDNDWWGSAGMVVGDTHIMLEGGGVLLGGAASVVNDGGAVVGGIGNTAVARASFVGGGSSNAAAARGAAAVGGFGNNADGTFSLVAGGRDNHAAGPAGGCQFEADASSVVGGRSNLAQGCYATVAGGGAADAVFGNRATAPYATISGGSNNAASSDFAVVSGGRDNQASAPFGTVSGGRGRIASDTDDWVAGGLVQNS